MQTIDFTGAAYQQARRQSNHEVIWALSAFSALLLLAYPIAALACSAALLLNLPDYTTRQARRLLAIVMFAAMSMIMSLRVFGGEADDMASYYSVYQSLLSNDSDAFFVFAGGAEMGLPIVFFVCARLLPELTPNGLMLVLALMSSTLFFCWVEATFYSMSTRTGGPLLMGTALLMLNISYSTQLVRQFLSVVIILYAFSAPTHVRRIFYLAVAATFHLSAIPFFIAYHLGKRGFLGVLVVVLSAIVFRTFFSQLLDLFDVLPPFLSDKLAYYVDNNAEYTVADLGSLKLLAQLCLISIASYAWSGFRLAPETRRWHVVPWVASIVHVALLAIPLASLRVTLMVHSVVAGVVAHKMIQPHHKKLLALVFNSLLFYKMIGYLSLEGSPAQYSTFEVLVNALQLNV